MPNLSIGLALFEGLGYNSIATPDICIIIMGTSGDWRGHIAGSGSVITPGATFEGLEIYEAKWNIVTGEFIISFGSTGNDEVPNTIQIMIKHPNRPDSNSAVWDSTNTDYRYIDLALAQYIGGDVTKSCFYVEFQPRLLIHYDFTIYTGTGV